MLAAFHKLEDAEKRERDERSDRSDLEAFVVQKFQNTGLRVGNHLPVDGRYICRDRAEIAAAFIVLAAFLAPLGGVVDGSEL